MVKAVIFDFFGVICPDLHWDFIRRHNLDNLGAYYEKLSEDVDTGHISEDEFLSSLSIKTGEPLSNVRTEIKSNILIDSEVVDFIKNLRSKYKIGLLSDASAPFLRQILKEHNLDNIFDVIGISSDIGHTKRDPESFRWMLSKLKINPPEAVLIDDDPPNVRHAADLGIKGIVYVSLSALKNSMTD